MTKTQAISTTILAKIATGLTVREALDAVCGAGSFDRLAGELYDELKARAKAGQ